MLLGIPAAASAVIPSASTDDNGLLRSARIGPTFLSRVKTRYGDVTTVDLAPGGKATASSLPIGSLAATWAATWGCNRNGGTRGRASRRCISARRAILSANVAGAWSASHSRSVGVDSDLPSSIRKRLVEVHGRPIAPCRSGRTGSREAGTTRGWKARSVCERSALCALFFSQRPSWITTMSEME